MDETITEDCFWSEGDEGLWFYSKADETKGPFEDFSLAVADYYQEPLPHRMDQWPYARR